MILNLTQHSATPEQSAEGVVDLAGDRLAQLRVLLTFDELPAPSEVAQRAEAIARLAIVELRERDPQGSDFGAMIGGAPFLMGPLEGALRFWGIRTLYAFSRRESVESADAEGRVTKTAVFRHLGFVAGA